MSTIRRQAPLVLPALGKHTATVIFAHGLGDSGAGWLQAAEQWRRKPALDEVKFILPHAPVIPISVNMGMQMPGWFDLKTLGPAALQDAFAVAELAGKEDRAGILLSRTYFHSLIQDEISAGIPSERIVIGGFSQGGAMSIFSGLTCPQKLGGIVGLSSWLLLHQSFKELVETSGNANKETPVLMGHGDRDVLVMYQLGTMTEKLLKESGYDVTLKTYKNMEHSACLEELDDVEAFLTRRLPKQEK